MLDSVIVAASTADSHAKASIMAATAAEEKALAAAQASPTGSVYDAARIEVLHLPGCGSNAAWFLLQMPAPLNTTPHQASKVICIVIC